MGRMYECPFFRAHKKLRVSCELGEMNFPDAVTRDEFLNCNCSAHPDWRKCSLAKVLNNHYCRQDEIDKKKTHRK